PSHLQLFVCHPLFIFLLFFFTVTSPSMIYILSLHDALPIYAFFNVALLIIITICIFISDCINLLFPVFSNRFNRTLSCDFFSFSVCLCLCPLCSFFKRHFD